MKATARIVAEADGHGGTRLTELYGEAPLLPRRTGSAADDPVELHFVGGAAGPLGGDWLTIDIHVGPGARLAVRTAAASVALPGPGLSRLAVTATVEGHLSWLPEPTVAATGCAHSMVSIVSLTADASVVWREEVIAGRHDEQPGRLNQNLTVRRAGTTLLQQRVDLVQWASPAVLGGRRACGSIVVVDPSWDHARSPATVSTPEADGARMALAGTAVLCSAVAANAVALRSALTGLLP